MDLITEAQVIALIEGAKLIYNEQGQLLAWIVDAEKCLGMSAPDARIVWKLYKDSEPVGRDWHDED